MLRIIKPDPFLKNTEGENIYIDFGEEKIEKALFLDIDGVIQPFTDHYIEYVNDDDKMEELFKKLESEFKVDYRKFHKFDVATAYCDWDRDAVKELKRVLDATGAKIVVSSSWRMGAPGDYLPFLLRMHDLQKYLYGYTPLFSGCSEHEGLEYDRSVEILEYLKMHPYIKKWVAVDDKDLSRDFPKNSVVTYPKITAEDADRCIEILND